MIEQAFARTLKHLRESRHLSQETLAAQAGLHRTYVSQLERGLKNPSLQTLYKLAKVLKLSLSEFLMHVEAELAHDNTES